ncbi:unnamed protein product [Angiostrongylus costaricensis]|uniref:Tnp_DDE_dom domain-containing protein n=1 Tax=Angiostrongylus costaricensis TaxID=334426 RepID=A0A0R3PCE6_ANGCS|nr:unnamed protein product [Angiostrongylus costaricensis]
MQLMTSDNAEWIDANGDHELKKGSERYGLDSNLHLILERTISVLENFDETHGILKNFEYCDQRQRSVLRSKESAEQPAYHRTIVGAFPNRNEREVQNGLIADTVIFTRETL